MTIDVGDAVTLTFATLTGATVTVDMYDPDGVQIVTATAVPEAPASSGLYPYTFVASAAGDWVAQFTASGTVTATQTYRTRAVDTLAVTLASPPFATLEDLKARPGGPYTSAQLADAQTVLADVSDEIRSLGGTWFPSAVPPSIVGMVCRVVRRELTNPDRKIGETYAAYSYRLADGQVAETGLLTQADRDEVARLIGRVAGDVALNLKLADNAYTNRAVARRRYGRRSPVGEDWRRR